MKFDNSEFTGGMVVGAAIIGMIFAFFLTLADVASRPAAHSASYAVLHSPSLHPYSTNDQSRAMKVSRSGLGSDLLVGVGQ